MKNIIIAVLLVGLAISGYMNYRNSKKVAVDVGVDSLRITFYGVNKIKDSLSPDPIVPYGLQTAGSITIPTNKCGNRPGFLLGPCTYEKQPVIPAPGVQGLDEILFVISNKYKNLQLGIERVPGQGDSVQTNIKTENK